MLHNTQLTNIVHLEIHLVSSIHVMKTYTGMQMSYNFGRYAPLLG